MSLTFLNPFILLGLAAAVLPILIHRLTHRKAVRRNFSAVRLLLHSRNLMARPQRLKHLLLLALRVMAIATLVVMAARPMFVRSGLLAMGGEGAKVLLIDNSVSMGYKDVQGERYERARHAAREVINVLNVPRDHTGEVLIMPTAPVQGRLPEEDAVGWMRPAEGAKYLASIPLSPGKGEPGAALALAFRKLKGVKGAKEIVLVSDLAKGDWQGFDPGKLGVVPADTHVTFLRIGRSARDSNMAVKAVRLAEGELVAGTPFRLEVTISNLSDQPASTVVQVMLGNTKVDQSAIELKAREDSKVYFELLPDRPGSINGLVRLSGDNLPYDDLFNFSLKVREKIKVLIVDGDPRGSIRASESYYLSRALQPGDAQGSPFQTKIISEKEYSGAIALKPYEALFLLNVAKPQPSNIAAFLDAGKPVFIFLGDRILPEEYNNIPLFPWRLGGIKEAAPRPESIARVDYGHEALKQFFGAGRESLQGAAFRRYFQVTGGTRTLLTLGNKDPLLLESPFGRGKIVLYTSSADADWNDLPLKAAYVPLIQGALKGATGLAKGEGMTAGSLGEPGIPPEESDLGKLDDEDVRGSSPA